MTNTNHCKQEESDQLIDRILTRVGARTFVKYLQDRGLIVTGGEICEAMTADAMAEYNVLMDCDVPHEEIEYLCRNDVANQLADVVLAWAREKRILGEGFF